jgi:hypothetical protein
MGVSNETKVKVEEGEKKFSELMKECIGRG